MEPLIALSGIDKELIHALDENISPIKGGVKKDSLSYAEICAWIEKNHNVQGDMLFQLEQAQAAVIKLVAKDLGIKDPKKEESTWNKIKYYLLLVTGMICFACEGFDGITNLLSIFATPTAVIFITGLLFSALSIIIFNGLETREMAKKLNINFKKTPQLIDIHVNQVNFLNLICKKIYEVYDDDKNLLEQRKSLLLAAKAKYDSLDNFRKEISDSLNNPSLISAKFLTAGIIGVLFFSGGYFSAQIVVTLTAALFFSPISYTFWPVILFSLIVGICALLSYWLSQREEIEDLVAKKFSRDSETVEILCDAKKVKTDKKAFDTTLKKINNYQASLKEKNELDSGLQERNHKNQQLESKVAAINNEVDGLKLEKAKSRVLLELHTFHAEGRRLKRLNFFSEKPIETKEENVLNFSILAN